MVSTKRVMSINLHHSVLFSAPAVSPCIPGSPPWPVSCFAGRECAQQIRDRRMDAVQEARPKISPVKSISSFSSSVMWFITMNLSCSQLCKILSSGQHHQKGPGMDCNYILIWVRKSFGQVLIVIWFSSYWFRCSVTIIDF
jgi:hypothetical protein